MLTEEKENYLKETYYDPKQPTSFSGAEKFYKFVKTQRPDISHGDVLKWLRKQNTYTLHRRVVRRFNRPRVMVPAKGYMLDLDTANYESYASENDGFKYIAFFTDVLSHFLYTIPLKTLSSKEMVDALKRILAKEKPTLIRSDRGSENMGAADKYMKAQGVKHVTTSDHSKANYAERVIRTVKGKLGRYMAYNKTRRWIDVLQDITDSYNNTYHRSIRMSPTEALSTNDATLWKNQYEKRLTPEKSKTEKVAPPKRLPRKSTFRFKVGDVVRLSKIPGTYDKETDQKWTDELFTISSRSLNQGIQKYDVKDFANEPIRDKFSADELQKVTVDRDTQYDIEKILRKRNVRGKTQVLVHWRGWPSKFDSWIEEDQVKDFSR